MILFPNKKYELIYADPPWKYGGADPKTRPIHYPRMNLSEICDLDISTISKPNCILFLWTTTAHLEESLKVIKSWKFIYKSHYIWVKSKIGTGWWNRNLHELLLIGGKGNIKAPDNAIREPSVFYADALKHSQKPIKVYEMLELYYPNKSKIELFARSTRFGWDAWGNELVAKTNADGEIIYVEKDKQITLF